MRILKSPNLDPDSPRAVVKEYFSWFEKITKWKRFRETRDCIKRGEDLFDLSDKELSEFGLMTPFKFNLYETILAALPAQITFKVVDFLFPYEKAKEQLAELKTRFWKNVAKDGDKFVDAIAPLLTPLWVPLVLLSMAWVVSRACLKDQDSTAAARSRCKRAYYYYNGAYGLMPQTLITLSITFADSGRQRDIDSVPMFITFMIFIIVAASYQLYVTYYKIPNLLFDLNGYSKKKFSLRRRKQLNPPPYMNYVLDVSGGHSLLGLVAKYVLLPVVATAIYLIAFIEVWLRTRLGML